MLGVDAMLYLTKASMAERFMNCADSFAQLLWGRVFGGRPSGFSHGLATAIHALLPVSDKLIDCSPKIDIMVLSVPRLTSFGLGRGYFF
jgi:hypothetical protein